MRGCKSVVGSRRYFDLSNNRRLALLLLATRCGFTINRKRPPRLVRLSWSQARHRPHRTITFEVANSNKLLIELGPFQPEWMLIHSNFCLVPRHFWLWTAFKGHGSPSDMNPPSINPNLLQHLSTVYGSDREPSTICQHSRDDLPDQS